MSSLNPNRPASQSVAAFRVEMSAGEAAAESAADQVARALHEPFRGRPHKMPRGAHQVAWQTWFHRGLPLAAYRIAQLIIAARDLSGHGREYVREHVLAPLAALNGDIVIPRPSRESIGTVEKEVAEAAVAFGGALLSTDRNEPLPIRAPKIAAAQRELNDLLEVSR